MIRSWWQRRGRQQAEVRQIMVGLPCPTFLSPGPPHYAARCRLQHGHKGEHDFPTAEESRAAWLADARTLLWASGGRDRSS